MAALLAAERNVEHLDVLLTVLTRLALLRARDMLRLRRRRTKGLCECKDIFCRLVSERAKFRGRALGVATSHFQKYFIFFTRSVLLL